jgi:hypothetical protein
MSLVKIKREVDSPGPYHAIQVGTRRKGVLDDPFWLVFPYGLDRDGYPYEDYEVERVPAHRGKYDPNHWGERHYDMHRLYSSPRHRKEGEAN